MQSNQSFLLINRTQTPTIPPHADHFHSVPEDGKSIGIDDIRKLKEWASLKPFSKNVKIALLSNLHTSTVAAQNALLKLLEEPPEMTYIIVHTNDIENILPTILSRCQRVHTLEEIPAPLEWEMVEEGKQNNTLVDIFTIENLSSNQLSLKEIIVLSEKLSKLDRQTYAQHIDETISYLSPYVYSNEMIPNILDILITLKKLIQQNCNIQLATENALISIFIDNKAKLLTE